MQAIVRAEPPDVWSITHRCISARLSGIITFAAVKRSQKRTSFLSRCPFSLFLPLNQVQRTLAFAAACRGVPIYLLYNRFAPPPWYSNTIGDGNSFRTLPFRTPFHVFVLVLKVPISISWAMLFAISAAFLIPSGSSPGDGVDQVTTSNHCSTTPIAMHFPRMSARARPAPAAFGALLPV